MSSLIENRACCAETGRSIHFHDSSWRKNRRWKIYIGYSRGDMGEMVELCLKVPVNEIWDKEYCDEIIEDHETIQELARKFNQRVSTAAGSKIRVIVPRKAVIQRTACVHNLKGRRRSLCQREWILIFEKIGNDLEDFVKRDGSSNDKVMQAFLHFTYHASGGRFVVSKLRGVRRGSRYVLSCPSIYDTDNDIKIVMRNHKCNSICSGFQMPQDLRHSSAETMPVEIPHAQPSAPPPEDSESDDDVFDPPSPKYEEGGFWLSNRNDNSPSFYYIPSVHDEQGDRGFGQGHPAPPPYSSHCPRGHRVAYPFEHCDVNGNQTMWNTNDPLLIFGDTAPVQQTSVNSYGLS